MATKTRIVTNGAPPSIGTHTQGLRVGGELVFLTGQTGRHPETGALEDGLVPQTKRMLANIEAVLNAAGCSPGDIVRVTLVMKNITDFKVIDEHYAAWLPIRGVTALPTRTAFGGVDLPAGALVMMDVIAAVPDGV